MAKVVERVQPMKRLPVTVLTCNKCGEYRDTRYLDIPCRCWRDPQQKRFDPITRKHEPLDTKIDLSRLDVGNAWHHWDDENKIRKAVNRGKREVRLGKKTAS